MISNDIKPQLHQYLGGTVRGLGGIALEINGMADHVHLLVKLKCLAGLRFRICRPQTG